MSEHLHLKNREKQEKPNKKHNLFFLVFLVFPCFLGYAQQLADTSMATASQ
jgi:hypothetical protein